MIIRECPFLVLLLDKIELFISDEKSQHPDLTDEEIIERIKIKFMSQS